jgi:organic radical activating enzyme
MRPILEFAEFYITNVCNLACPQCINFNHLNFSGRYDFDLATYQAWSKKVNIKHFYMLGGEPTLHPKLGDWIRGVRQCWPQARASLLSNGTHLSKCAGLEQLLVENNFELNISLHNSAMKDFLLEEIYKTFGHCEIVREDFPRHGQVYNKFFLRSHKGVLIELVNAALFHQNALINNSFELHDSDPELAHQVCSNQKCHNFIDGKLYKCAIVKLVPMLFEQNNQPVPELYGKYQPLEVTDDITQELLDAFGKNSIEQCRFCPEQLEYKSNPARFKNKQLNIKILGV